MQLMNYIVNDREGELWEAMGRQSLYLTTGSFFISVTEMAFHANDRAAPKWLILPYFNWLTN